MPVKARSAKLSETLVNISDPSTGTPLGQEIFEEKKILVRERTVQLDITFLWVKTLTATPNIIFPYFSDYFIS